jgi:hypothetical protein
MTPSRPSDSRARESENQAQVNQGQAPYSGKHRDILADSARRFDIPAHNS